MPDQEQSTMPAGSLSGASRGIDRLLEVMQRLRDPQSGCPWDLAQDFKTIVPHTIEEAYEVADAIETGDDVGLRDELGDLLFQVVFYAQLASEEDRFDFDDIAGAHADKMIARHPHVFDRENSDQNIDVPNMWEQKKADERAAKAKELGQAQPSVLDGVIGGLPATTRALKLQKRAARVGFDWPELSQVIDKVDEEISEFKELLPIDKTISEDHRDSLEAELGDVLFAVINAARHLGIDPERALRATNRKFEYRFHVVEQDIDKMGKTPDQTTLDEMEVSWQRAKSAG